MNRGDISLACARAMVDSLAAAGIRHAVVAPGSRSTPMALALWRHETIEVHVFLDERAGAFFALGLAKASGVPVAVATTSGTATAECFPAVVEASQSRTPLLLLTADRPPRLRGTGANQTIDQVGLYGGYARDWIEPPVPEEGSDAAAWSEAGTRAARSATGRPPGPVHVNLPFDEPLVPEGEEPETHAVTDGVDPSQPETAEPPDPGPAIRALSGRSGVVLAGASPAPLTGAATIAERLGWPLIAEPLSGVRTPGRALAAGLHLLGSAGWIDEHRPQAVLQLGAAPTTRRVQDLVSTTERLVVVDDHHLDPDVEGRAAVRLSASADALAAALDPEGFRPAPGAWLDDWRLADVSARRVLDEVLDRSDAPTEPQLTRDLAAAIPDGGDLFVGNSTPVRDLDMVMAPRDGLRVMANRGASGIDGLVSTALGVAAGGDGLTVGLLGDLSFVVDVGALLWQARRGARLTLVVVDNRGGQIFSMLGQRDLPELSELFTTPHGLDLASLCAAAGASHTRVTETWAFAPAIEHALTGDGVSVVEVGADAETGRIQRAAIQDAVDDALQGL